MSSKDIFNDGCLSQFKKDENRIKVVTHLDHLKEPYNSDFHIEDEFDANGVFLGTNLNGKFR